MDVAALRANLEASRAELAAAIRAMAERWEEPCLPSEAPQINRGADETWTPRQAMQHAIIGQLFHAQVMARAAFDLPDADAALHVLAVLAGATDAVVQEIGDADLARFASGIGEGQVAYLTQLGIEPRRDLETALRLSAGHLRDHAQQLQKAARD